MATSLYLLRKDAYARLIGKLLETNQVYAPVAEGKRIGYRRITSAGEQAQEYILPDLSAKAFVFPRVEKLFSFLRTKEDVTVQDFDPDRIPHRVVLGVRPCDAAGLQSLKSIFEWDPADPIFEARLQRTTLIGYSCATSDAYCFCTSVGGNPGDTRGSDVLLTRIEEGDYMAEVLTPKGEALIASCPELFESFNGTFEKEKYLASVPARFDSASLKGKIEAAFDTESFDAYALRCIGCGACAFVCPTCACFDIQDETRGSKGKRTRSWDTCASKLFTLHTSGHNPRTTQGARWRQRLMHKFSYMPERLDTLGCVGCGRCSRRCPADMNLAEHLSQL